DFSTTTINKVVGKIRSNLNLRELLPLENEKEIGEQSIGTYFMVYSGYLTVPPSLDYKRIFSAQTDRFAYYQAYFEVHKLSPDDINVIGFVSQESFVRLNQSKSPTVNVDLFPYPYEEFKTSLMVIIPIRTIVSSKTRNIPLSNSPFDSDETKVLTIELKNLNK
ncbi:MAG: hypothetical protein Q8Q92_04530, partial [bacterium]|nr:hypothetical protein [bacterium]